MLLCHAYAKPQETQSPMSTKLMRLILCFIAVIAVVLPLGAADWPTFGHDPQRTGWAFEEETLSPQNAAQLQLKWKTEVKNEPKSLTALTAPVVADGVSTAQGKKTLVYVAGSSDEFYALDAATGTPIWQRTFKTHVLPKDAGMWLCPDNLNDTPVIDKSTNRIYVIASDGKLYGLDLGTGDVKFGPTQFVPPYSKNWSLNLVDGVIYTSISQGCGGAPSGIYSMDVRDRYHPSTHDFVVADNGGGIWGRGGVTIGKNGRVYAETGDGEFDPPDGQYSSSIVAASLGDLGLLDYYVPLDFREITKYDLDMGASGAVWFGYGDHELLAAAGKQGVAYLLNADLLGSRDHQTPLYRRQLANDDAAFAGKGIWGAPSFWRDTDGEEWVYFPIVGPASKHAPEFPATNGPTPHGCVMAFKVTTDLSTKQPTLSPAWVSGDFDVPEPVVIANGVVFALSTGENTNQTQGSAVIYHGQKLLTDTERTENTRRAVLYALDAKTGKTLYQSGDAMATWVHFSGLAVANGRVYAVDHGSSVYCFGLKNQEGK